MRCTGVGHGGVISQGYGKNQPFAKRAALPSVGQRAEYRKILRLFDDPLGVAMRPKRMYHQHAVECETSAKKGFMMMRGDRGGSSARSAAGSRSRSMRSAPVQPAARLYVDDIGKHLTSDPASS
jgi:hypothetical protein